MIRNLKNLEETKIGTSIPFVLVGLRHTKLKGNGAVPEQAQKLGENV